LLLRSTEIKPLFLDLLFNFNNNFLYKKYVEGVGFDSRIWSEF